MYYRLYTLLAWLLVLAVTPVIILYCLLTGRELDSLWQRFGFDIPTREWHTTARLWFHAASVGEVQVVKSLISNLYQRGIKGDFIITTVTRQGHLAATKHLSGLALCLYAPIDIPWALKRFINRLRPACYICLETELWPNTLRMMRSRGIKTFLLNGRLSERSFKRYSKIPGFIRQVVRSFDAVAVIQEIDSERYQALGVAREAIRVTGNAKYDLSLAILAGRKVDDERCSDEQLRETIVKHYKKLLRLRDDQPVLLAGSTHSGEEMMMVEAYAALSPLIPGLTLVLAPRHLERIDQIKSELRSRNLAFTTVTEIKATSPRERIIVIDMMGELAGMYSIAAYVFCGGSLVDRGGHNIMEPAMWAKPPMYGPSMGDFSEARAMLETHQAGFLVKNTEELIGKILYFQQHQEFYHQAAKRALQVAAAQQGAATRQAEMICQALAA